MWLIPSFLVEAVAAAVTL